MSVTHPGAGEMATRQPAEHTLNRRKLIGGFLAAAAGIGGVGVAFNKLTSESPATEIDTAPLREVSDEQQTSGENQVSANDAAAGNTEAEEVRLVRAADLYADMPYADPKSLEGLTTSQITEVGRIPYEYHATPEEVMEKVLQQFSLLFNAGYTKEALDASQKAGITHAEWVEKNIAEPFREGLLGRWATDPGADENNAKLKDLQAFFAKRFSAASHTSSIVHQPSLDLLTQITNNGIYGIKKFGDGAVRATADISILNDIPDEYGVEYPGFELEGTLFIQASHNDEDSYDIIADFEVDSRQID